MKKIYLHDSLFLPLKDKTKKLLYLLIWSALSLPFGFFAQQTYTFTNCNATGNLGPSQTQINNAYTSTNLSGSVTQMGNGVQSWTVPMTGAYGIRAIGGSGGITTSGCLTPGGMGGNIYGEFNLTAGQVLRILVGHQGGSSQNSMDGGGGGGSYVATSGSVAMVVAGGGGGATSNLSGCSGQQRAGLNASPTETATNGANGLGAGGGGGNGGTGTGGGAGGGFLTNGTGGGATSFGISFMNGGAGGTYNTAGVGGFGGGGSGFWEGGNGGGGGGFSGGGTNSSSPYSGGGGGSSFNAGTNAVNAVATSSGYGRVIISELCNIKIFALGTNSINPSICSGQSLTLTTTAINNYTWSNSVTTTTAIVVSPTSTQTYSIIGTSSANCQAVAFITVTVSAALPVLSIANPSNNICLGKTVSLTATGALTYTWVNPGVVNGQTFTPNATAVYTVNGQNGCGITSATTTVVVAPLPVSVLATPSLVCEGYPSTLTAVSSVPNYTWKPGSIPGSSVVVSPGSTTLYTVTATDGTCAGTQTLLLTTKPTPTITAATTSSFICEGDQITLTANGAGTGGSYSWTPGGTGASINQAPLTTTVFVVAGTNSVGCTAIAQQVVLVNAAPPMTLSAVANKTMICSGQSTTLNAIGAPGYSWVNGPTQTPNTVSPTAAVTIYTALGTHQTNTCVATRTIEVSVITPSVILTPSATICVGQQAVLNASGATSYTWNGLNIPSGTYSISPATTTTYTLLTSTKVGTLSCPKSYTAMVTVHPLPTLSVTAKRTTVCKGETNTLTATGASSYSWGTTPGTSSVVTITPTSLQTYVITGTDVNGCKNTINYVAKVSGCVGLNESSLDMVLSVYPNPSSGEFILSTEKDIEVELFSELGQHLRSITLNEANNHEVKINDLAPGIYFIKAQNNDFKISQKIVITK